MWHERRVDKCDRSSSSSSSDSHVVSQNIPQPLLHQRLLHGITRHSQRAVGRPRHGVAVQRCETKAKRVVLEAEEEREGLGEEAAVELRLGSKGHSNGGEGCVLQCDASGSLSHAAGPRA
jgi:hypothetical protein